MVSMMDLLTHLFLPITSSTSSGPSCSNTHSLAFGMAGFAVLPDVDKLLSVPESLHLLVTLFPKVLAIVLGERLFHIIL